MTFVLGLTGSIGTGKSTTAGFFREAGVPVNDADEVVHALYAGKAAPLIEATFPGTTVDGVVDRPRLSAQLSADPRRFKDLEAIVHPMVREVEQAFVDHHRAIATPLIVLDIPLLFEAGGRNRVDAVLVVTCDAAIQRQRVLARPGMTEEKFALILSRQMPDAQKRERADYLIDTGHGLDEARASVQALAKQLGHGTEGSSDA